MAEDSTRPTAIPGSRTPPVLKIVPVMPKASDLLIFNSLLAHGIRPIPRKIKSAMAQYISMTPADESRQDLREIRIRSWKEMEPPQGFAFPGDPREWEKEELFASQADSARREVAGIEEVERLSTSGVGRTLFVRRFDVDFLAGLEKVKSRAADKSVRPTILISDGVNMTHGPIPGWRPLGLGCSGPVGAASSLFVP